MSDDRTDAQDALQDVIDELEVENARLQREFVDRLSAKNKKLREALAFARSVIKSGEDWSEQCEEIINGALRE